MFFLKRNKLLLEKIKEYFKLADTDITIFNKAMESLIESGVSKEFDLEYKKSTMLESDADSILHDIEGFLYKKSLLPESREDVLILLEKFDDVLDGADHILKYVDTRNIKIPQFIADDIREMLKVSIECYENTRDAILDLLGKRIMIKTYIRTINDYESIVDKLQMEVTKKIFSSEIDNFHKLLLAELTVAIGKLTDYCENAADSIAIMNIKRIV